MRNVVILVGAAGAGKGTQGRLLGFRLLMPNISVGEMLRDEVSRRTNLSRRIVGQMEAGGLVDDDLVNRSVKKRISRCDCRFSFILDGYPRSIAQAEFLESLLNPEDRVKVAHIDVTSDQLLNRLASRRICPGCDAIYNLITAPPLEENTCDMCLGKLKERADDRGEVILERFRSYREQTEPLLTYYKERGVYYWVDGGLAVDQVSDRICSIISDTPFLASTQMA